MLCSLKLSSRNADRFVERRSFLGAADAPSSSTLAWERDDERSPSARAGAAPSAWPAPPLPRSSGKELVLSMGDDDRPPRPRSSQWQNQKSTKTGAETTLTKNSIA